MREVAPSTASVSLPWAGATLASLARRTTLASLARRTTLASRTTDVVARFNLCHRHAPGAYPALNTRYREQLKGWRARAPSSN
jgi:hypothetical protein